MDEGTTRDDSGRHRRRRRRPGAARRRSSRQEAGQEDIATGPSRLSRPKALAVLLQNSFRNIVRDQADRRTADPPPSPADPRPTQFTFSDAPMMG